MSSPDQVNQARSRRPKGPGLPAGIIVALSSLWAAVPVSADRGSAVMAVFCDNDFTPGYSIWDGSAWSAAQSMPIIPNPGHHIRVADCPTRTETACIYQIHEYQAYFLRFDGSSWSAITEVSSDISNGGLSGNQKNMQLSDVAYEQTSGDGLIAYNESGNLKYQTFTGGGLSGETTIIPTTDLASLELFATPTGDQIYLLCADNKSDLKVNVWDGSAWGGFTSIGTVDPALYDSGEFRMPYFLAFEGQSGDALVVYSDGTTTPKYRTCSGAWSGESSMPDIEGEAHWVRLAADPGSDTIVFVAQDHQLDLNVNVWDGSSWATSAGSGQKEIETSMKNGKFRAFDVTFEPVTGQALVVWNRKDRNRFSYRTWAGSSWTSAAQSAELINQAYQVRLAPGSMSGEAFMLIRTDEQEIFAARWDGSSMSGATNLAVNSHGDGECHNIAIVTPRVPVGAQPRIIRWTEVDPND
ncbi:MAG: hypothetical protein JSV91_12760 [Phycisphaerales bacterium]|nr:MAG: hypothetical protein JSV91_12760 [Phycisphaerales bacterium]